MMKMDLRHGKVCYWALIFSVAAHSVTLAVFTGVTLSGETQKEVLPKPVISLQMIERVVAQPTPRPKPRIEPIAEPVVQSEPEQPPLIPGPQPTEPTVVDTSLEADSPQTNTPIANPQADEVEFFGQKSMVRRVCYVVDCSGSMYGQMYQVKNQLKKSILDLNSRQSFSIVFFMEGQTVLTSDGGTLAPATARAKSTALELIESVRPSGSTDAEHALEVAMRLKNASGEGVEAVYFLTDGFDLDSTHASNTVLHTIGFDAQPQDCQMLRRLAQNTGGAFININ
ncbi:MAG: vWA domain-containing protein [Planctomycetota bacterium]|jgi:hypothetical protein